MELNSQLAVTTIFGKVLSQKCQTLNRGTKPRQALKWTLSAMMSQNKMHAIHNKNTCAKFLWATIEKVLIDHISTKKEDIEFLLAGMDIRQLI